MRKYLPIFIVLVILGIIGYVVISKKHIQKSTPIVQTQTIYLGTFSKQENCVRPPLFLKQHNIPQPVMIDLSQKQYKGIALHYGKDFTQVYHPNTWETFEHFGTYTLDKHGHIYLVPIPYISIRPTTFNLQKNLYKLDSNTGKISIFMHFEDIKPSADNPYGLNAIAYDCDDDTIWVAAIDESNYQKQKGVIYHIDPKTKEILQAVEGMDVLSLVLLKNKNGKYLLVGSARDNALYAYAIKDQKLQDTPLKVLEMPHANEHIRKIKVTGDNTLELQTIPFSYTLIAQTAKEDRIHYKASWCKETLKWQIKYQ